MKKSCIKDKTNERKKLCVESERGGGKRNRERIRREEQNVRITVVTSRQCTIVL